MNNSFVLYTQNGISFAEKILSFIDDSSILSGLVVAGIIGWVAQYLFLTPKFLLRIWNEKQDELHIQVESKKRFVSYEYGTVFYTAYFPEVVFRNFVVEAHDKDKTPEPWHKLKPFGRYKILDEIYIQYKGAVLNHLYPDRPSLFLRVKGQLDSNAIRGHKIYVAFSTKYGTYPRRDSNKRAQVGKLPFIELNENTMNQRFP